MEKHLKYVIAAIIIIAALALILTKNTQIIEHQYGPIRVLDENTTGTTFTITYFNPTNSTPLASAIVNNGSSAYVLDSNGSVSVLNLTSDKVTTVIKLNQTANRTPTYIVADPDGKTVYVLSNSSYQILSADLPWNVTGASGLYYGGYTFTNATGYLTIINTTNYKLSYPKLIVENPEGIAVTPDGKYIYIPGHLNNPSPNAIPHVSHIDYIVNTQNMALENLSNIPNYDSQEIEIFKGFGYQYLFISPLGHFINYTSSNLVQLKNGSIPLNTVNQPPQCSASIDSEAISPNGKHLYASYVWAYKTAHCSFLDTFNLSNGTYTFSQSRTAYSGHLAVSPDGKYIYLTGYGTVIFNASTLDTISNISSSSNNYGILVSIKDTPAK